MKKFMKKTEGFTLVELIVVIAILGILAGVGTVGYSGYIKKANMAADEQLAASVKQSLELGYYSNIGKDFSGYVVLSKDAAPDCSNTAVEDCLKATFGENLSGLKLKYDGWTAGGVLNSVLADENVKYVAGSNFVKNYTPSQLVGAVSGVTDALVETILGAGKDPVEKLADLDALSETQLNNIKTDLQKMNVTWVQGGDNAKYSDALSNLMVKYVADEYKTMDFDDYCENGAESQLGNMALNYALVYAWASTSEDGHAVLEEMNAAMSDREVDSNGLIAAFLEGAEKAQNDSNYLDTMYETDYMAVHSIMGTVSDISKDFDMGTAGLYSSASISGLVNNYTNAVVAADRLTSDQRGDLLEKLENGSVVVLVGADGMAVSAPDFTR